MASCAFQPPEMIPARENNTEVAKILVAFASNTWLLVELFILMDVILDLSFIFFLLLQIFLIFLAEFKIFMISQQISFSFGATININLIYKYTNVIAACWDLSYLFFVFHARTHFLIFPHLICS